MSSSPEFVFKIISQADWNAASAAGRFEGVGIDVSDKFIHLSTAEQVAGTLERFFAGRTDLLLLRVPTAPLGDRLKFEDASHGDGRLFPHLFGGGFDTAELVVHTVGYDEASQKHQLPQLD